MKSLQHKCATTSPKDLQEGKERKRRDKSVKISPVGPVRRLGCHAALIEAVLADLIHQVLGHIQKSGGGKPWENPQNTISVGFLFTQVQVGKPTYLPWGRSFTLGEVLLWIMGHFWGPWHLLNQHSCPSHQCSWVHCGPSAEMKLRRGL